LCRLQKVKILPEKELRGLLCPYFFSITLNNLLLGRVYRGILNLSDGSIYEGQVEECLISGKQTFCK